MHDWEGLVRGIYRERAKRPTDRACRELQLVPHEQLPRALLDCSSAFEDGTEPERDEQGDFFVLISSRAYHQAATSPLRFNVYPPKLLRFKSFDGLETSCMYYHPKGKEAVLVVFNIYGGPESQSTAETKMSLPFFLSLLVMVLIFAL